MVSPVRVLCVMPTYNRVAARKTLIEEAVESFLQQTYLHSDLVIVNDHQNQIIKFDHPRVIILNLCNRACSLGEKYNEAIRRFDHPLICTWEDDDISLPHRLEYSVKKLGKNDYFNPMRYWFLTDKLHHEFSGGYCHNASLFTRKAFEKVGGYDHRTGDQDRWMDEKLRNTKFKETVVPLSEAFYLYRFGLSDLHLSGQTEPQKSYDLYEMQARERGTFLLRPHWETDYSAMVSKYLADNGLKNQ